MLFYGYVPAVIMYKHMCSTFIFSTNIFCVFWYILFLQLYSFQYFVIIHAKNNSVLKIIILYKLLA